MMLVLGNGRVVTRDASCPFIEDGAVAIEDTKICRIGKTQDIRSAFPDAEYIDAKGGLIMPAFINVHEHIYSSFARGLSIRGYDPKGFLDILDGMWWTIDRNLTLHDTYLSAMATYVDCIKNGVTTVFDHHASFGSVEGSLFEIEKAAKETGVRSCLCYEISDRDGMDKARASVMENAEFIRHALKDESGNGLHVNISLEKEGRNIFVENGRDAQAFIAGVMNRAAEITAFSDPLPQSYERLGRCEAPKYITWSRGNRSQLVRVPYADEGGRRIELRSPDPSCNPYVVFALLIEAGLEGIKLDLPLPPACDKNMFDEKEGGYAALPESLESAAKLARESAFVQKVLSREFTEKYLDR